MNTTPECSPTPMKQPVDCPPPPVIIQQPIDCPQQPIICPQQPIDCPLPPVTNPNQNIYVDSSVSDATLTSVQPSGSDISLSNATSRQTTDCEYSQSCGTDRQTSDYECTQSDVPSKPNTGYYSQSNQTSDYEYSRTNLRNRQNNDCQRPPIVIEECPQPPVVLPECPLPPIVIKECPCPQPPVVLPECPRPPIVIKECPQPPVVIPLCPLPPIKECPRPLPVVAKECPSRSKVIKACSRSTRQMESPSRSRVIKECSRSSRSIRESPSRSKVIKACSRSTRQMESPSRSKVIKECSRSSRAIKESPSRSKVVKECSRSSSRAIKESPSRSKVIKQCSRSSRAIKESSSHSKIIKQCSRSSRAIQEFPVPLAVVSQNIQCLRPPVLAKPTSSVRSNIKTTQSTNYEPSVSDVPTQQASSTLNYPGPIVVAEQEPLLRSQSEPTLGQKSEVVQSKVATVKSSHTQLNFELIRSESRLTLERSLSSVLKPGLSGLREFMSSSLLNTAQGSSFLESDLPHLNKFIDYFIECDGLRYMGILEQIEYDFEDRVKAALLNARANTQAEAQYLRDKLVNIGQVQPAYQQISLKEIDFPELLNKEMKILSFDYKAKIDAIRRIHVYGLDMEKYWLTQLNTGKDVDKVEVYDIGTQMLAELMAQLFSLLVKSCEFLMEVNEDVKMYTGKLSAESLIHLFTEFRRLLVEEVGAVGETCGSVMVHIPYLKDDDIIEIMTKLYNQVNFVDICICRALKPVVPLVMLFDCQRVSEPKYNFAELS